MSQIDMIVAVDRGWGIGYQNHLLFHLKQDMAFFKEKTLGNVVIMGRKTLESFPDARPLPGRKNIVLSRNVNWQRRQQNLNESLVVLSSVDEVLASAEQENRDVYVIGGESVYRQFLAYVTDVYVTKIDSEQTADRFFPNLDEMPQWRQVAASGTIQDESGISFEIVKYQHNPG